MMGLTLHNTAMGIGVVFLLVGVLGFIPVITTNYGAMTFAGHESGAMLLGVCRVSVLHNIVHLLFGVAEGRGDEGGSSVAADSTSGLKLNHGPQAPDEPGS
jgi:hypothetical protein